MHECVYRSCVCACMCACVCACARACTCVSLCMHACAPAHLNTAKNIMSVCSDLP